MTIAQEEIFGPVLAIMPYDDEEDAVRIANDSIYGLAGGVWSARRGAREARRAADPHRPGRDQRRRLQPARAVRRLQAVGPRPRARQVRARGVPPGERRCSSRTRRRRRARDLRGPRRRPRTPGTPSASGNTPSELSVLRSVTRASRPGLTDGAGRAAVAESARPRHRPRKMPLFTALTFQRPLIEPRPARARAEVAACAGPTSPPGST